MADEVKQPLSEKASKDEAKQLSETASQSEVKQLSETDVHKESDLVSDDDEKPETMAEDSKTADEQVAGLEMTLTVPEPPKANEKAIEFLSSIGEDELLLTAFSETLGCFSDTKAQIGEFTILVQPAIYRGFEDCYLVHVTSHSTIDDIPCNSSIYAYVSKRFETLEQQRQEYIKMKEQFLEKKTHMVKQGDKLVVESFITEGKHFAPQLVKHHTTSYPWNTLEGFVSQASNFLILRILARRRAVPENMIFLVFDGEKNLCQSTYDELGFQMQTIGQDTIDVYGIERTIHSEVDLPISWQNYFLADGHLSSRFQVGSPISMKVLSMPVLVEKGGAECRSCHLHATAP
uniref:Ciliogenesis-associated TTC17-interacting protein n=1 Tax=Geotrypetes seraphini TaxID=260995 RepID=A0A6P8QWK6_GEOSA|nr:ciliogenesis-associated TTC17-interacting protein isoform X2 [Geotrypetes seraphini]